MVETGLAKPPQPGFVEERPSGYQVGIEIARASMPKLSMPSTVCHVRTCVRSTHVIGMLRTKNSRGPAFTDFALKCVSGDRLSDEVFAWHAAVPRS